jgi:hypothetical protein
MNFYTQKTTGAWHAWRTTSSTTAAALLAALHPLLLLLLHPSMTKSVEKRPALLLSGSTTISQPLASLRHSKPFSNQQKKCQT